MACHDIDQSLISIEQTLKLVGCFNGYNVRAHAAAVTAVTKGTTASLWNDVPNATRTI